MSAGTLAPLRATRQGPRTDWAGTGLMGLSGFAAFLIVAMVAIITPPGAKTAMPPANGTKSTPSRGKYLLKGVPHSARNLAATKPISPRKVNSRSMPAVGTPSHFAQ